MRQKPLAVSYKLSAGRDTGFAKSPRLRISASPRRERGSYQLSAISCQPDKTRLVDDSVSPRLRVTASPRHSSARPAPRIPSPESRVPFSLPASAERRAFTLIEMVVVVAIMGLLLAIAIPVSVGVVKGNQSRATETTLETVKSAIEVFQNRKPLNSLRNTSVGSWYRSNYGPLPASPTAALNPYSWTDPDNEYTTVKFTEPLTISGGIITGGIVDLCLNPDWNPGSQQRYFYAKMVGINPSFLPVPAAKNSRVTYPTIECLVFLLRHYSPEAKAILDRLGKSLTNEDADVVWDKNPMNPKAQMKVDDLYEIRDAWGNVIQYNLTSLDIPGGHQLTWELRSAGPDGKFMIPFTAAEAGDDVVVSGSYKKENE